MTSSFAQLFRQVAANMTAVAESGYGAEIERAARLIADTFAAGGKLLVFGNGGSSTDAQHLAAELVGRFAGDPRRALPAIALTTNQAMLTAWSNDVSFDDVFARQIEALGRRGDVAVAISTSGNSPNVVAGARKARELGLKVVALTGPTGGHLRGLCDVLLAAPVEGTARIQEVHLVTYHAICAALDEDVRRGRLLAGHGKDL